MNLGIGIPPYALAYFNLFQPCFLSFSTASTFAISSELLASRIDGRVRAEYPSQGKYHN
jgi:hypothetical protein